MSLPMTFGTSKQLMVIFLFENRLFSLRSKTFKCSLDVALPVMPKMSMASDLTGCRPSAVVNLFVTNDF